jgi:hypothetical protein
MVKNMGTADRSIRTILALIVGVLLVTGQITGTLGIIAVIFLLTSLIGNCPLYMPFKITTRKGPIA